MPDAKVHKIRIQIIMILIMLLGIVVIYRLFTLQIIKGKEYAERAERQYVTPSGSIFDRGTIYLTKKDGTTVAGATIATGYKVAIAPASIVNQKKTFESLNSIIPIDEEDFYKKAGKKKDPYEEIINRISKETADEISKLNLPGVSIFKEKWRFYPGGNLASQTIGFVSYKENELLGRYGLERSYNPTLARYASDLYVNFFAEIFANIQSTLFKNRGSTGDLITALEPTVQTMLEETLAKVIEKWGSDQVGGIVMDPKTGEILALGHLPDFDLNNFSKVKNVSIYSNPLVESVFEMGSIVKPLVMAGAIDVGAVTPQTMYTDKGSVAVDDRIFSNFDKKARGTVNMQEVLSQSLNTGMVFVSQKMGKDNLREYFTRYKVGEKTGVDMPGEISGLVSNLKTPGNVAYATASFGQGIATTPVAIVRAYSALANGGVMVTPHLGKKIKYQNGTEKDIEFKNSDQILKPETVETVREMLVNVVDKGYKRGLPNFSIAAKTGTAQIAKSDGSGYYDDRNLHSLIGYFPSTNPRFILYLYSFYPKGASFAAQTLADPFFEMVKSLISYYQIPPDR